MNYKLKTVDAETLLSTPMSKTMFIVDGLIPQGVNDLLSISFVTLILFIIIAQKLIAFNTATVTFSPTGYKRTPQNA